MAAKRYAHGGVSGVLRHPRDPAGRGSRATTMGFMLAVWICICARVVAAIEPVPQAHDILTVVKRDTQKDVRLDANLYIPDGGELVLNIDVPRESIVVDNQAPAKVTRVYSTHANGIFGVGEAIDVLMEFTSAVDVVGSPTLQLATGCHASSCHIREVQRLRCQGTVGKFAVGFDNQRVANIPWDATATQFANYITRMTKIDRVLVDYHQSDGSACTFFGNNITVTFESVNIDGVDGDLPEMTADIANNNGDGTSLGHVRLDATLSATAWEITKGKFVTDRLATFVDQPDPRTLRFRYTVVDGDNTTALEYANTDALTRSLLASKNTVQIRNAGSLVAADTTLPPPQFVGDWERGMGSSLSANSVIGVDVSRPKITSISSTHDDGTFGIGEVLAIQVVFTLPVMVTGLPTIVLETGQVDRIIPFKRVTGATKNIVEFEYIVQAKDTSPDLTYTGTTALQLNGGSIKRQSTAPWTDAILTLPINGEKGSLSWSKNIVIDTSDPKVVSVTSMTPDGTYTGGDTIQIQVVFDVPVVVTGTPQLMLSTASTDLYPGSFVQVAPTELSPKTIVFPAVDHGLSTLRSQGLQFRIDGQIYSLATVNGDAVTMVENFVGRIVDPRNIGGPTISIMSPGYRPAKYVSGSGTTNIMFAYEVQQGDSSLDLGYLSTSSLQLNGGAIKRLSTTPFSDAVLTLATPGTTGSLSLAASIMINTNLPRVLQVNSLTRDGVYRAGDEIYLAVVFNLPVVVQLSASIKTTATTAEDHFAVYDRGSGTTTLVFKFVCQAGDQVTVFDVVDTKALLPAYGLTGGFIRRRSTSPLVAAILDLPAAGLSTKAIAIDQASAYIVDVSTTHEDDSAGVGEVIDITVTFNVAVNVDVTAGNPLLLLTTQKMASYISGSGSVVLTFRYTVQADDPRVRVGYVDIFSLIMNGAVIRATATTKLAATLLPQPQTTTLSSQRNIQIDAGAPTVIDVSNRQLDGDYTVGDRIVIAVSMNVPVVVAPALANFGVPTLYLQLGGSGNIATPASFVSANDEQIYFAVTIASGHATANLAYPSRVALRCVGNYGLNKDPTLSNAISPHGVEFQGRFFGMWSEKSAAGPSQIRSESLDVSNPFAVAWRQEDGDGVTGHIQFDATRDATNPMMVALPDGRLFACWQERSSTAGNPTQIRVVLYVGGDATVLTRWRFVGRTAPATTVGLNRDSTQSGASPHIVFHASKLYMAWHESIPASATTQIRAVVYNGLDNTPAWAFVDGNSALRGINYASSRAARNVRLLSCRGALYAAWEEENAAGTSQIRVATMGGTDAAPRWSFVDGNSASVGLNYDVTMPARMPSLACVTDTMIVVAWHEGVVLPNGLSRTRIRAKQLTVTTSGAAWRSADATKGLNFDVTLNALNVRLRVHPLSTSTLYATWGEVSAVTSKSQVRVALFTGGDSGSWQFVDGGSKLSMINDVPTQDATTPVLVGSSSSSSTWYAVWQEMHTTTQTTHVRSSLFRASTVGGGGGGGGGSVWQSLHDRCVLRRSTACSTPSSLLLPESNTFGALDYGRHLRIDTASPTVQNISFVSSSNVMTKASAVQTVDVFNTGSLTQGQYQLAYDGEETICLDWNAPAVAVKAAIEGIAAMKLSVQVALSTAEFQDASRYTITFAFPATGLKPLSLAPSSSCAAWTCGGLATARLPCNANTLVQLNTNRNVAMRSGIVDALVQFTSPVRFVAGGGALPPKLTLETGLIDTQAVYTTRGVLRQFDVGAESPSRVLHGAFRLAYGDSTAANAMETTECIAIAFDSDTDAEQELLAKLLVIKPIRTIGIQSVSRIKRRNGYRYKVFFSKSTSSSDLFDLVPADSSTCDAFAGRTQTIDVQADQPILQGGFKVSFEDETTACISATMRAKGPTNSMEDVLSRMVRDRVIPLQVVRDTSVFGLTGHRYYVSFISTSDAIHPISVSTANCAAFLCDDGNGGTVTCTGVKVVANADFTATLAVTNTLVFEYAAQDTDSTPALAVRDSSALVGNLFRQSLNPVLPAMLTVPKAALAPSTIRILSSPEFPRVAKVFSSTADDTYSAGDIIVIYVVFSAPVDVVGKPILELNSGGVANFLSGSGTTTLEFRYKILPGENSADLNYVSPISLRTPGMFVYICVAGAADQASARIDADLTLPAVGDAASLASQNALVVATAPPTVVSVSSTRPDSAVRGSGYGVGDIIDIVVVFSSEISVRGAPTIALNSGGTATFAYGGYRQLLDIGVHAMYPVTSGQFAISYGGVASPCIDFNDASSAAPTSLKSRLLAYPELATIGIVSVTKTVKKNGGRFEIVFDSTKVLQVPTSVIPVLSDVCAPLLPSSSDSSPSQLLERAVDTSAVFQYVVQENDATNQLDYVGTAIDVTGTGVSIQSRSRTPTVSVDVTLPAPASPNRLGEQKSLVVDGSPVVVVDIVSDSAAGTYGVAFPPVASPATVYPGEIYFRLIFSRSVKVVGKPQVELATGSLQANGIFLPNRFASFVSQPQPNEVAFLYHIQESDLSPNLAFASLDVLASATVFCVSTSSQTLARTKLPRLLVSDTNVLKIDATSVPTTVEISSPHPDGLFGAGEAIEIDVIFSKQVTLQTGLNRNHDFHARYPVAVEYQGMLFVFWTEWSAYYYKPAATTSFLYLRAFDSTTLAQISLSTPIAKAINQLPNTFIEKVSATVWLGDLYAAWDENGQIYCAQFNGLAAPVVGWTLIPNMGANKNLQMRASDVQLFVHNLQLVMVWREEAVVPSTGKIAGQIRVAQRNEDLDAPLWIFHDGNQQSIGLNKNPRNDAMQPHAAVHRGGMYVAWTEYSDSIDAYQIVVARRYVQNRDQSVWLFLEFTGQSSDFYISSYRPRLTVRKKGFEDMSLYVTWYRDTRVANLSEVRHGEVLETTWNESTVSLPQQLSDSALSSIWPNTQALEMVACGNTLFASWIQESSSAVDSRAQTLRIASLAADLAVDTAWKPVFRDVNTSANHNAIYDVNEAALVCASSSQPLGTMGIFWTEFDGISSKLRLRHANIPQRLESERNVTWGETDNGSPLLQLDTASIPSGYAFAIDRSGLTSKTLRFLYVVYPGQSSVDLDVLNQQAFVLNGAQVRDYQDQLPDFTLFPTSQDPRSLSFNNQLVIDTTPPVIADVTSANPSDEYGVGERILVQIKFNLAVAVGLDGGQPLLYLRSDELHLIGYLVNPAMYISGSGTDTLVFEFISSDQDYCDGLDYFRSDSLSVPTGSWIRRNATFPITDATIALPTPHTAHSLSGNKQISIKPTQPTVVSVTSPKPDGVYYPGDAIPIVVTFTLPVVVYGEPAILLDTGNAANPSQAKYLSGNNTRALTFQYFVLEGDAASDLDVVDDRGVNEINYVQSLKLLGQSRIKRLSTTPVTDANVILPAPGLPGSLSSNGNLVIDTVRPKIVDVRTTTPDGTYDVGEVVEILVEFSKIIVVTGTPYLKLNILTPKDRTLPRTAVYQDGSGSNVLRFTYTVDVGDNTGSTPLDMMDTRSFIPKPLSVIGSLSQIPAQVLCKATQPTLPANLTMPRPGVILRVDAVRSLVGNNRKIFLRTDGLRVVSIGADVASAEVYAPGQRVVVSVVFSRIVIVQGTPRLGLNANALLLTYATYFSGSGSTTLLFEYIVAMGDSVPMLEAASRKALELPGGSLITDDTGLAVPLRLGAPLLPGSLSFNFKIGISSTPPVVQRVFVNNMAASFSGDTFGAGDDIVIAVQFSRKIKLSTVGAPAPPTLSLQFSNGVRSATYVSGDSTSALLFTIRIAVGDVATPLEYASVNALVLAVVPGIYALSTTLTLAANSVFPGIGAAGSLTATSNIRVVSSPPVVMSVNSLDRDGTYGLGDRLRISVKFSYRVTVTLGASPCVLELFLGGSQVSVAAFVGGSTTATLTFEYRIAAGDRSGRLDYRNTASLSCTILQLSANPSLAADTTLPAPGSEGSLGFNARIRVDSAAPQIVSVSSAVNNGIYGAGQDIDLVVSFSEAVEVVDPALCNPTLRLSVANVQVAPLRIASATYRSGTGTAAIAFRYTTVIGDMALPIAYDGVDALSMERFPHCSFQATTADRRRASLRLPVPGGSGSLSNNKDIRVDAVEPPRVVSVSSAMADGIYTAGDVVTLVTTFSTPVMVTGAPYVLLDTGSANGPAQAVYQSGSNSVILTFAYRIQEGDHSDRLDYVRCPDVARIRPSKREFDKLVKCTADQSALQLGLGGAIKRSATVPIVDAVLDLPEVNLWPKIRVATSRQSFTYVNQLEDISDLSDTERAQVLAAEYTRTLRNEVSMSLSRTSITIYSNGIPSHATTFLPVEQRYFIELVRFPTLQTNPLLLQAFDGFVGIMLNGIPFKRRPTIPSPVLDACGGTVDDTNRYYYGDAPSCYLASLTQSLQDPDSKTPFLKIGYAFDGIPVFYYFNETGQIPQQLDECNGIRGADGGYRYHLVPSQPNPFMPCLKGINDPDPASVSKVLNLINVFRSPVDVRQVEGLSLPFLSQFEGLVVDENPATVAGTAMWLNPKGVSVVYSATTVIVRSTGIPSGQYGPFPNAYNRFVVREQDYVFQFPRQPAIAPQPTKLPVDAPIGVMLNGIPFFASVSPVYSGNLMDPQTQAYWMLDRCHGLVDAGGNYRYYGLPDCLLTELGGQLTPGKPSPLLGYALDGFPLYGPYGESGTAPTDLDACNGRIGDDGSYRYHATPGVSPYLIGCFMGTPSITTNDPVYRSLSYAKALRIDTQTPRVLQIFTNKMPGSYALGETLDLVTMWSAPVTVDTTTGVPSIPVVGAQVPAIYSATKSQPLRTVFQYTVTNAETAAMEYNYDFRESIRLNGGSIKRAAAVPTLAADLRLVWAEQNSRFASKHQLVKDVRIALRGLYHPHASDLSATLFHETRSASVFDQCCRDMAFGIPDKRLRINEDQINIYPNNPTSGVGWDYGFQDFLATTNLARDGGATARQSTTSGSCYASNAIDGRVRGMVTSQDVARTDASADTVAWWELRLVRPVEVGTIRVWLPQRPDRHPAVVQILSVNSNDGISQVYGSFTLSFTTWDNSVVSTVAINWNAVAMIRDENPRIENLGIGKGESLEAKILAAIPATVRSSKPLFITRSPPVALASVNDAFTWSITFLDDTYLYKPGAVPLAVDTNSICDGTGVVQFSKPYPGDDHDEWAYKSRDDDRRSDGKASMFPFWILLYEDTAVMNFDSFKEAANASIWKYRVDESQNISQMASVNPPVGLQATQFIRIVAEQSSAFLTIAEVDVFKERNHIWSQYSGGSPVSTEFYPGAETWSPEDSFQERFGQRTSEGRWSLVIQDAVRRQQPHRERDPIHGAGAISDWVLQITNLAGKTRTYYMDIKAQLKTLPRHGKVYVSIAQTDTEHLDRDRNDVLDLVEAERYLSSYVLSFDVLPSATRRRVLWNFYDGYTQNGGIEVLADPSERQKIYPSPVCDRQCLETLGLDPYYWGGTTGDRALKPMEIRRDRVVRYIPNAGFEGEDTLTYTISVGSQESTVRGTVQLHVAQCREADCTHDSTFLQRERINP